MSDPKSINELNADLFQPEEVDRFSDPVETRKKAMDYLARREYGRLELERKLEHAGFDIEIVSSTVSRLTDEGLQDDLRFAESFAQSRVNKGNGPVRVRQELAERGISSMHVEEAMQALEQDWFALAREVRARKFGPGLPSDFPEKARQMRFLQYRGFEQDQIQVAVSTHGDD